jgi:polysaccharide export outer membrane protein
MRSMTGVTTTKGLRLSKLGISMWRELVRCLVASSLLTVRLLAQTSGSATGSAQQSPQLSSAVITGMQNIPISPGDLLDVQVFNTPELSTNLRVDQLGRVTLPLGGDVEARGLTATAAANAIKMKLVSAQIMLHPMVTVKIMEYATEGVTVLGEVRSPGIYTLLGPHSLYDALASAGGATPSAGATITITHADDADHPLVVKVTTPNYSPEQKAAIIKPGDTVVVSKADLVYIVGDVTRSGAFYIQNGQPLTVLDLVSLAQGTTRTSAMSHVAIVRPTPDGGALTIHLNLNKVMKNEEKNLVLAAGDILVVPRSGWKTFSTSALPSITNAAANAVAVAIVD